jgi:hypothetical protein
MMKTKAAKTAAGEIFKSNSLCVLCVLLRLFNFGVRAKSLSEKGGVGHLG